MNNYLFIVTYYLRVAESEEISKPNEEHSVEISGLKGVRVLLVEDNDLNREIAEDILIEEGLEVTTAQDGMMALDILNKADEGPFDVILMDIQMPKMDGYTATREIRCLSDADKAQIPIVAMTANVYDEDRNRALEAGMNGFVVKPLDVDELLDAIKKAVGEKDNTEK